MSAKSIDIAIAGGGLAGGLTALALTAARPELRVVLVEQGTTLGGNHRWSWFASDVPDSAGNALLDCFRLTRWKEYDVRFPHLARTLATPYRSLASADFDAGLRKLLPADTISCHAPIASLDACGIDLANGERIAARTVIDARGIADTTGLTGGWQVFMGRHLRTTRPHGTERPTIMDAAIEQPGAYRFFYTLPLNDEELFVEDTYYADSPVLDPAVLADRIDRYCTQRGWNGDTLGTETGVLPVITGGSLGRFRAAHAVPSVAAIGARGGFVHPLTSYTLPFAVDTALAVARHAHLPGPQLAAIIEARAAALWRQTAFYRALGKMLFGAAPPSHRYRIFERFYRLPQPLIERFYAARSTQRDRARILCGRPPVPIGAAMRSLIGSGTPLERHVA